MKHAQFGEEQLPSSQSAPWLAGLPIDPLDPEATLHSFLLGPEDAYDERRWFERHREQEPVPTPITDWYHATYVDLPEGTVLAPRKGKPPWLDNPYHGGLDNRANWTWVEFDLTHSDEWAGYMVRDHGTFFLYHVKPRIGPFPWNGHAHEGWVTDAAVIMDRVDEQQRQQLAHRHASRDFRRLAMPTYYHITENPKFKLDPNFTPEHIGYESGDDEVDPGPGIYLTQDPDLWRHRYPGRSDRGHTVEFETDEDLKDYPEMTPDWSSFDRDLGREPEQYFVPSDYLHLLRQKGTR